MWQKVNKWLVDFDEKTEKQQSTTDKETLSSTQDFL